MVLEATERLAVRAGASSVASNASRASLLRLPHEEFVVVAAARQHLLIERPLQPAHLLLMAIQLLHNTRA